MSEKMQKMKLENSSRRSHEKLQEEREKFRTMPPLVRRSTLMTNSIFSRRLLELQNIGNKQGMN